MDNILIISLIIAFIFVCVSIFQITLALGFPFGEAALGGFHKVLPKPLRVVSAVNAIILLFMAMVFLVHADVMANPFSLPIHTLLWVITMFLVLNTVANAFSQSKKEKYIMTPLTLVLFTLCLSVVLMSG
ncbi:hypothetical protein [Bacillus sp. FJAT-45037]|uniref:hypothetical protein n=1 Tax=Bacillus sp. FJAT-45037 TaxID=2011007 RepID=UPI000C23E9F6|nr:hypothetical protein [Bacillus sp. FJAT-45037]